jgi:DNA/RNA endonuclease YhcR with UshA esterase domain
MRSAVVSVITSCFVALLILAAVPAAQAHHSTAMYDMEHPTTIKGVVKNVEWTNPHGYIYLDVKNDKGSVDEWAVEINSPNFLRHNGWTSSMVKSGDTITVTGGAAKSGAKTMRCTTVVLADGTELRS